MKAVMITARRNRRFVKAEHEVRERLFDGGSAPCGQKNSLELNRLECKLFVPKQSTSLSLGRRIVQQSKADFKSERERCSNASECPPSASGRQRPEFCSAFPNPGRIPKQSPGLRALRATLGYKG